MICSNCFKGEYVTIKTSKEVRINGHLKIIKDIECEQCPSCNEIIFTSQQSFTLDEKRRIRNVSLER